MVLTTALLVVACAAGPAAVAPPADTVGAGDPTASFLSFARDLQDLPPAALARRRADLEHSYHLNGDPAARLRLAILLQTVPFPDGERARRRAMRLLEQHVADPKASARELAALLRTILAEWRHAASDAEERAEAERARAVLLGQELTRVEERLERERIRRLEAERKLEALKVIERQINRRPGSGESTP